MQTTKTITATDLRVLLGELFHDEPGTLDHAVTLANRWVRRGDHAAIYENQDLGHPGLGHKKVVSYGSPAAQLEVAEPPQVLPDIGTEINWRYVLVAVYEGDDLLPL